MLITDNEIIKKYGDPRKDRSEWEALNMVSFKSLAGFNIYCHEVFKPVIERWFAELKDKNLLSEIKKYDGCFNIRMQRGAKDRLSRHSWGLAIDLNAVDNPFLTDRITCAKLKLRPFTEKFVEVSRKHVDCGWDWVRKDGMHFQLKGLL
jgi:hypothetical protein